MIAGKMAENVIGTDLAPGVHREQLARFDPENSQMLTGKSFGSSPPDSYCLEKKATINTILDALLGLGSVH